MPATRSDWERVGRQLAERRVQISARYANRRAFAEDVGMNWRTLYDAEYGKRATFRQETVRAIETAYRLLLGSLARSLAGGPLEPARGPRAADAPPLAPATVARPPGAPADIEDPKDDAAARLFPGDTRHDRIIRNIWRLGEFGTSREDRLDMIEVVDPGLAAALRDVGGQQSEAGLSAAVQVHVQSRVHGNESDTLGVSGHHRTLFVRDD